ncbi:UdgX family uracil-DNA binding protein [soil metagenome]
MARVPAAFLQLCREVILHSEPQRLALLYRLLWRLVHEPTLRHDPIDADMMLARSLAQAVRRDMHKMKAFVRFRTVQPEDGQCAPGDAMAPLHVAWFEPDHHIVRAVAPWFARRFTQMRWAILTPRCCIEWDGLVLSLRPGARREDAPPADAGEHLWLTYYQHIFNPARLKLAMMQKEMPRKYWRNLPEATLIAPLAARAMERSSVMIHQPATSPARRIPAAVTAQAAGGAPVPIAIDSLDVIKQATMRCRQCPIGEHATQSVTGCGPLKARLMLVGEQPGDQEDLRGQAFVGPAGQLLNQALERLQIPRGEIFVTNAVKHFKFELRGKRRIHKTPTQREAAACLHWLEDEIRLVQPAGVIALGATAARSLLGRAIAVTQERGKFLQRHDGLPVLVTLHPSALLRMPVEQKEEAFEAFVRDLGHAWDVLRPGTGL